MKSLQQYFAARIIIKCFGTAFDTINYEEPAIYRNTDSYVLSGRGSGIYIYDFIAGFQYSFCQQFCLHKKKNPLKSMTSEGL